MRRVMFLTALTVAIFSLGCSDDSDSKQDTGLTGDSNLQQDSGTTADLSATADSREPAQMDIGLVLLDSGDAPWTCSQIAQCQKECGQDTNCLGQCSSRGCDSAKTAIGDLTECAIKECITSCVGGFNEACNTCTAAACPEIYEACTSNTCE